MGFIKDLTAFESNLAGFETRLLKETKNPCVFETVGLRSSDGRATG